MWAVRLLPPLGHRRRGLEISGIEVRPVIQRCFRLRGGSDRPGRGEKNNLAKPYRRARSPVPANACHFRSPQYAQWHRRDTRSAVSGLVIPRHFFPKGNKKPSHWVKGPNPIMIGSLPAGLPRAHMEAPRETEMRRKASSLHASTWTFPALLVLAWAFWPGTSAFAADEPDLIFRRSTVFKWVSPNDKLATYGVDDPEVEGVACHFTVPEKGGFKGWLGLAEEVSDISLACRQIGPIRFKDKMAQGDDMFRRRRSLFFKKMQIVRGCDAKRNVLVYMVYSDKLIDGSPKNSTSTVPIMPWGMSDSAVQKCGEFIQ